MGIRVLGAAWIRRRYVQPAGFSVAQASVDETLGSKVAAFIALGQTGGITVSLAIANSVFVNEATRRWDKVFCQGLSTDQIMTALTSIGSDFFEKLKPEMRVLVLDSIVEVMRKVYILVVVAGVSVVILSLGMKGERLFLSSPAAGC